MTVPYRKKLIEVGLPLVAINAESAREKSIRHGHPSTLHLWWARRPLAACRAVLFSSLVDDPDSDPAYRKADGTVDEDRAGLKRADLFNFIEELVMWENSNNADVIRTARAEIARCVASRLIETGAMKKDAVVGPKTTAYDLVKLGHCRPVPMGLDKKVGRVRFSCDVSRLPPADVVNAFLAEHAPPVLDPFAGGGSIPLEAQRLGLRAYASDLNPVPVLINKALIEIPPKFAGRPPVNPVSRGDEAVTKGKGKKSKLPMEHDWPGATGLAEDVRYYGKWMRDEAEKRIGHLYPKVDVTAEMAQDRPELKDSVGKEFPVMAWIWSRTVECPNPACRLRVPLMKSFALCTKANRPQKVVPRITISSHTVSFDIIKGKTAEEERTISRKGGICLRCGTAIPYDYIRNEAKAGRMLSQMVSKVCDGGNKRLHLPVSSSDVELAKSEKPDWTPELELAYNPFSLRPALYGLERYADLFTDRQMIAMSAFADQIPRVRQMLRKVTDDGYADAVTILLALSVSKLANRCSNVCFWDPGGEKIQQVFARQAIAMSWDFVESNPIGDASGGFIGQVQYLATVIENSPIQCAIGHVIQHDASLPYPDESLHPILSTDPPYYDNIDYADLSDFFYVWLRHMLRGTLPELFATVSTPKTEELVATPYRFDGDRARATEHFTTGSRRVFSLLARNVTLEVPSTVVYGFKQQEEVSSEKTGDSRVSTGWETFLESLFEAGFTITGTWPLRTELVGNLKGHMNALASSIVLVCRPRRDSAMLATRKEFLNALRLEMPEALRNLQRGNIAPVDLAQAAIGPGMAVFTRYAKVMESDGSSMTVRTALGLINQSLDEVLAEQEGEFDSDTRWALAWFEQFGMNEGPFGDAETLSKAKNTAVNGLVEAGIITARAGKVRLVKRDELPADWIPATDKRLTVWEITQHLIRTLDQHGELGAAALVQQLGGMADISRDLAYRLYSTCERKKWSQEAMAYNSLVVAWSELTKLALSSRNRQTEKQHDLFT